eukprot:GHVU01006569.1.p2 GENE.GHVU01006569.1~~GHVU01006569.1.p2  ORF type:complete len:106 (+),score=2.08 GHVU01006569.1:41-358(+)
MSTNGECQQQRVTAITESVKQLRLWGYPPQRSSPGGLLLLRGATAPTLVKIPPRIPTPKQRKIICSIESVVHTACTATGTTPGTTRGAAEQETTRTRDTRDPSIT